MKQVEIGNLRLQLPRFFASVSSVRTNLATLDYVQVLVAVRFPQFLLSAYDFQNADETAKREITECVREARGSGAAVLLDSGNYESYWHGREWTAQQFHEGCLRVSPNFAFSFDVPEDAPEENSADAVLQGLQRDLAALPGIPVIPIVHGSEHRLPELVEAVARRAPVPMIAVAERELGDGIGKRAETIRRIRGALDTFPEHRALHILGTGNPTSIVLYALAGADTFDGLEWCQTTVDFETGQLLHFHQWDLVAPSSPVHQLANLEDIPYQQRVLAHNLVFYAQLMSSLRGYLSGRTAEGALGRILKRIETVGGMSAR